MEKSENLLVRLALEVKQVFYRVNVEWIPLQLKTCWVWVGTSMVKSWLHKTVALITLEHPWVQQIINSLIVNLKERDIELDIFEFFKRLYLLD